MEGRSLLGVQEVPSSNLGGPTKFLRLIGTNPLQTSGLESNWSPDSLTFAVRVWTRAEPSSTSCQSGWGQATQADSEQGLRYGSEGVLANEPT